MYGKKICRNMKSSGSYDTGKWGKLEELHVLVVLIKTYGFSIVMYAMNA